jgi:ATP-dependent DNA helicase RecG
MNSLGGKLFIGVHDDGNIMGIQNPDKISLAEGLEKPYYLKKYGMSVKGCYTRIGSQSSPMKQKLIHEFSLRRIANTLSNVVNPNQHLAFTQLGIYYAVKGFEASDVHILAAGNL